MITEYLAPIASAVGIVKTIKELWPAKADDNGVKEQLSLLMKRLAEAQQSSLAMAEENLRLRQQVEDGKKELAAFTDFEFRDHMYWRKGTEGQNAGPFCQPCWDRDRRASRIHPVGEGHVCAVCNFSVGLNRPKRPRVISPGVDVWR